MMISNQEQLTLLLRCLGCGVWLNLTWELMGIPRQLWMHSKVSRFLFDCLLAILSGFGLFLFSLAVNGGELRAVMLAAIAAGGFVSHASLGRVLHLLLRALNRWIGAVFAVFERGFQQGAEYARKIRKKVVFFYKKGLQIGHSWVYNRNNK